MITRGISTDVFFENSAPALEELIYDEYERYDDMIGAVFNVRPGTGWGTQSSEMSGLGASVEIGEGASVVYDEPVQGNLKTFKLVKFGYGVNITEEMIDDDRFDQVQDILRAMGVGMFHARQISAMANFNNGFSTNGYDGVPLFSTSHPLVKVGGTFANRPAADVDLSVEGLRTAINDLLATVDHAGVNMYLKPKTILVNSQNLWDAYELLKSDKRPDVNNNAVNAFSQFPMDYINSEYLTDTDAWFIICTRHKLMWYDRKLPVVSSKEDFDATSMKTKILSRWDSGHSSAFGLWGTTG